jgi:hypothetical protein
MSPYCNFLLLEKNIVLDHFLYFDELCCEFVAMLFALQTKIENVS